MSNPQALVPPVSSCIDSENHRGIAPDSLRWRMAGDRLRDFGLVPSPVLDPLSWLDRVNPQTGRRDPAQALDPETVKRWMEWARVRVQGVDGAAVGGSPHAITCGERSSSDCNVGLPSGVVEVSKALIIDWLSVTFSRDALPSDVGADEDYAVSWLVRKFAEMVPVCKLEVSESANGRQYYQRCFLLPEKSGYVLIGGQNNTIHITLTGVGCGTVASWDAVRVFCASLGGQVSRCDIAVDVLDPDWGVERCLSLYLQGLFNSGGRRPEHDTRGPWFGERTRRKGRTIYIGTRRAGRQLCCYEKGKQLGGDAPEGWCRWELRLYGDTRRQVPLEVLTNPAPYFAGAYWALSEMCKVEKGIRIQVDRARLVATEERHKAWLRRCAGRAIWFVTETEPGETIADKLSSFMIEEIPTSLARAGAALVDGRLVFRADLVADGVVPDY